MELNYTTQTEGFDSHKHYRNPKYFQGVEQNVTKVVIVGDWPEVKAAYGDVTLKGGGKVEIEVIAETKPSTQSAGDPLTAGGTDGQSAAGAADSEQTPPGP